MLYFAVEGNLNKTYNATSKARNDVNYILENNNFVKLYINSKNVIQSKNKLICKQLFIYTSNINKWKIILDDLKKGDVILIQYPLVNFTLFFERIIKKYQKKGIVFIALVHDLESLRLTDKKHNIIFRTIFKREDKFVLNCFDYIIAHNNSMKNELIKLGNDSNKIVELKLFDYLLDSKVKKIKRTKNDPIIIAGNLSLEKAQYLSYLNKLDVKFNLFGAGFNNEIKGDNICYKGKFLPEELLNHLEGSFGLVWDGNSINECSGEYGNYLKYNNPHKASLYLTGGIPIIVWKKSALASFVVENKVGFAVESLHDIKKYLNKMSDDEYFKMIENTKNISKKSKNGKYLLDAVNLILKKL